MSPPELSADAPVLQVTHPGKVGIFPVAWDKLDVSVFNRFNCWFGQALHGYVPLVGQVRFDDNSAAVPARNLESVVFNFFQQAGCFHVGHDLFAGFKTVHAAIGFGCIVVNGGIVRQDINKLKIMTFTHFVVVKVMGGGDFYAAGTKLGIHVFISDDRNFTIAQRQGDGFTHQGLETFVIRMHGES